MSKDLASAREVRWFKKLNQPTSGTYRVAHAVRANNAKPFKAEAVFKVIDANAETELAKHVEASALLRPRRKTSVKRPDAYGTTKKK